MSREVELAFHRAKSEAEARGHAIVWSNVSERVASGRCSRCGRYMTVAASDEGVLTERIGLAVEEACDTASRVAQDASRSARVTS